MSFINPDVAAGFSKEYDDFFTYFSREFIVHKEPVQILQQIENAPLYGYGSTSDSVNYTYVPVTGIYKGRIHYNNIRNIESVDPDLKLVIARGDVTLKVKKDARDFISNGKTIKLEFDGKAWNIVTEDLVRKYLNNTYYIYGLEQTK